jgi:NAD(P)-dependent dehydrogenase (short-subunit alcohol dehydrogenase family)
MGKLTGQTALITGSTQGIGRAIAERFAAEGANVVLCGRSRDKGLALQERLRSGGARALFVPMDITQEAQVEAVVAAGVQAFGGLDILVNNAGPTGPEIGMGFIHELSTAAFDQTMQIGLYGTFWCCKYALPALIASGRGSIINISSLAVGRAIPKFTAYAMTKAAMNALGRQIANDYAAQKVRCNSLLVGTVRPEPDTESPLPHTLDIGGIDQVIRSTTMLGKVGTYEDVALASVFLASADSRYITGAELPVDGGAWARVQYPDYTTLGTL